MRQQSWETWGWHTYLLVNEPVLNSNWSKTATKILTLDYRDWDTFQIYQTTR